MIEETQRLKENVFRDECIFIYNLSDIRTVVIDEFKKIMINKSNTSQKDLENYRIMTEEKGYLNNFLKDIKTRIKIFNNKEDYTGINEKTGKPVINELMFLIEKKSYELRENFILTLKIK